ncbi:MAG TPA: Hsp20/alpha crystallin family protein [Thermoanaerobaculia bacterium]|nr:Hsp20/alpha crystallin family protein [Thermoanaerobaculia bacterium]
MTFLTRSNDLRRLEARMFEPFFRFAFQEQASATWNPPVDVLEEKDKIVVKVEVPGVEEKDLRVTFEDGVLTIAGERQFEQKEERSYHRIERSYGSFTRTFSLPRSVDVAQIAATYTSGVLEVSIPKKDEAQLKQIAINVNANKQVNA